MQHMTSTNAERLSMNCVELLVLTGYRKRSYLTMDLSLHLINSLNLCRKTALSTPWFHPTTLAQSNGAAERSVRVVKDALCLRVNRAVFL